MNMLIGDTGDTFQNLLLNYYALAYILVHILFFCTTMLYFSALAKLLIYILNL